MKGRHLPHLNQADAPSVYPIAFFNELQIFSREKGFGEYQKNDRWNAKKSTASTRGKPDQLGCSVRP
jgi:hypothetical protein